MKHPLNLWIFPIVNHHKISNDSSLENLLIYRALGNFQQFYSLFFEYYQEY